MEKLNKLFALAQRADAYGNLINCVNPHDVIDIAESFLAMKKRAEAAEAEVQRLNATAQPKCQKCGDTGMADSGGTQPWGEQILIECDCATAQPVSDGWVSVPRSLTAENGAKAALLGEFSVQQNITCHECFGEGCDDCNGQGNWTNSVPVDWTTIKEIWAKGVEHFSPAAPGGQDD